MPAIELPKQQASYVHNQIMTSSTPAPVPATIDLPLPLSPQTILHLQITPLETSILAFLTTTDQSNATSLSPLGSFVYAMPNRLNPAEPLCTALCALPSSIDFATRLARVIARLANKPVYIGCSVILGDSTVEVEMSAFRLATQSIMNSLRKEEVAPSG